MAAHVFVSSGIVAALLNQVPLSSSTHFSVVNMLLKPDRSCSAICQILFWQLLLLHTLTAVHSLKMCKTSSMPTLASVVESMCLHVFRRVCILQGSHSTPEPFMSKPLADRTNQGTATQTSAGSAGRLQHPSKSHTISHSVLRTSHTMTHPAADENSARGNLLPAAQQCRHPVPMGPADVSHDLEKQADEAESLADEHDSSQQHAPTAVVGAPQSDDAQSSRPPVHLAEEAVQDAHLLEDVSIAGNNEDSALSRESPGRQTFAAHVSITRPTAPACPVLAKQ